MEYNDDAQEKKSFGQHLKQFFKNLWYDFVHAFKYNNMKAAAIFFALPGLLIGFFISCHYEMIVNLPNTYTSYQETSTVTITGDSSNYKLDVSAFKIMLKVAGTETEQSVAFKFEGTPTAAGSFYGKYYATECTVYNINSDFAKDEVYIEFTDTQRADGQYNGIFYYTAMNAGQKGEVQHINFKYTFGENNLPNAITAEDWAGTKTILPFDFSAMSIFFLMLTGILNIFVALNLSGKKNLGTVITATFTTLIMLGFTALYFVAIFSSYNACMNHIIQYNWEWTFPKIWAMISVAMADLFAIIGLILSWIFYDRTYQKVDR